MKTRILAGALACALSSSSAFAMSSTTPISTDKLQQAAKNAAAVAQIFACDVSTLANVAFAVENAVNAGGQVVRTGTTTKVVGVSSVLCQQIGGINSAVTAAQVSTATKN
jgi:hypothetical protein